MEKFVSKQFSNLFSSYTQAYNKKYDRKGSLFLKTFKRKVIESDRQFQDTFLYINLNAEKHGFTRNALNWNWSSYRAYQNLETESLLKRSEVVAYFDSLDNMKYCF